MSDFMRKRTSSNTLLPEINNPIPLNRFKLSGIWIFLAGILFGMVLQRQLFSPVNEEISRWRGKHTECLILMQKQQEQTKRMVQKATVLPAPCQFVSSNGTVKELVKEDSIQKKQDVKKPEIGPEVTPAKFMNILPESSVWCTGTSQHDRTCRFRNLCYSAKHENWFILKTNRTIQEGVPRVHRYKGPFLETSSIDNHPYFDWNFMEVDPFLDEFRNINVRYEELTHFLFKRLHPRNIMHNLHDDVLNLYYLIKKYNGIATEPGRMVLPFSLFAHRILMLDPYEGTDSTRPFQYLSNHPLRFFSYVSTKDRDVDVTCFRDAIIGSSTVTKWYQYGFYQDPQGPLPSLPNGNHVREVGEWIVKRMVLPLGFDEQYPTLEPPSLGPEKNDNSHYDFTETDLIIILSRKGNRLILNEQELADDLTTAFGYKTQFVRNEDHSFEEQIKILRRARIVVGMHGSILVMTMFCRRGTVFIEMFPFAVPSEHYTPYRTMSNLPGMDIVYLAWENKHEDLSVGHPDRHRLNGGLGHLSAEEKQKVLDTKTVPRHKCCTSPYWLYRIYQDTTVTTSEVIELIKQGLVTSRMNVLPRIYYTNYHKSNDILPGPITALECVDGDHREKGTLWASWKPAWNGATVDRWDVLINNDGKVYGTTSNATSISIPGYTPGTEIVFFVRPVVSDQVGDWGEFGKCTV